MDIIFFITMDEEKTRIMSKLLKDYKIINPKRNKLQKAIFEYKPIMVIIDIDSFNSTQLQIFQYILSVEYVPTLCVYNNEENKLKTSEFKDALCLSMEELNNTIQYIVKQSVNIYNQYLKIEQNYEAIDYLNSSIKSITNKYLRTDFPGSIFIFIRILQRIYIKSNLLNNKPENICIFFYANKKRYGIIIALENSNVYSDDLAIIAFDEVNDKVQYGFDIRKENGFYKNYSSNEISDIDMNQNSLPTIITKNINTINNFAGVNIDEIIIFGVNYKAKVSNYEVEFLKAVAVKIDLITNIKLKMEDIQNSFIYTMNALARAAECKDDVTGHHIKRVNMFSKIIAEELGLEQEFIDNIYNAAQMHDVGKLKINEAILNKPGRLTEEEYEEMKKHTVYGEKIIGNSQYLNLAAKIARWHHEKYDGTGYPDGLKGDEIPLGARIVFLADIYDALRSPRPYKPSFSHDKAHKIITEGDGRVEPYHFDPKILAVFTRVHAKFNEIYNNLID